MSGFISAAAVLISFNQLNHLLGINIESDYVFLIVLEVISKLPEINIVVFILGIVSTLIRRDFAEPRLLVWNIIRRWRNNSV